MTTIEKLIASIISICADLGIRSKYEPEEMASLVCEIQFTALYDALRDRAEPVYAYAMRPSSTKMVSSTRASRSIWSTRCSPLPLPWMAKRSTWWRTTAARTPRPR